MPDFITHVHLQDAHDGHLLEFRVDQTMRR